MQYKDSRLKTAKKVQHLLDHPNSRLKPGETLGEYEKKLTTLAKLNGKRLELESENREKYKALDNEMLHARAKGEVARNDKFRDTIAMFQNLLQPGDKDKNSKYYNDMIDALTVARESFSSNSRPGKTTKAQAMEQLSKAAKAYVEAKESQFRPFPTVRRNTRLQSAKSLLAFAENADKQIKAEGELDRSVFRSIMERDMMGKQDATVELAHNIAKKMTVAKTAPQKANSEVQRSNERASINMNIPNNGH